MDGEAAPLEPSVPDDEDAIPGPLVARRRSLAPTRALVRSMGAMLVFLIGLAVVWEAFKWLAGDPWRFPDFGYEHFPPFHLNQASDLSLPHIWDVLGALGRPVQRSSEQSLGQFLAGAALYTWGEALIGFVVGTLVGIALATLFVHSRLAERAFVPYVIASQTIPIVALAPLIIVGLGQGLLSVVFIATYLTFFPVTIAELRGLRSPDPRSLELMRSYAASRRSIFWKVRLPASVPYLFSALKIAATASVVGTIIGEDPGGASQGLGRAIVNFNQQYITGPEKLWATILVASLLGMAFYLVVRVIEVIALRGRLVAEA
ncbi:MAG: NitT/TauT family transport system permease protein [Chloroflexota bacterium]|jgi:NitT/TauT family transport system permease protein|nr:NitT/TauT family transport system permease protein [Chloroflexota bacterium]